MQLNQDGDQYYATSGRRYAILPLDEEHFEIDANSRIITVPTSFRKNGIAVKGDQVAEIVYFRIARYFDFMDLNNTDIFIQWESVAEDGSSIKGVSTEWVRDIESDPDYLIFGWALDSGTDTEPGVTSNSGNVKFSVRFIIRDEEGSDLEYSLNTLEASAIINKTLILDNEEFDNAIEHSEFINNMILKRMRSSLVVGADQANLPEFTTTLLQWTNGQQSVDLTDGEYPFAVHAYASDAGKLTYQWYLDGELKEESTDEDFDYFPTKDTKPVAGKIYYIQISDDVYEVDTTIDDKINLPDPEKHYEKLCTYTATTSGEYEVIAKNTVKLSSSSLSGGKILIPGPSTIVFEKNGGNYIFANGVTELELNPNMIKEEKTDYVYQWSLNNVDLQDSYSTQQIYKIEKDTEIGYKKELQGDYKLNVKAVKNNSEPLEQNTNNFFVTYPADPIKAVKYQEKQSDNDYIDAGSVHQIGDIIKAVPEFTYNYQLDNRYTLSYEWYHQKGSNTPEKIDVPLTTKEIKLEEAWAAEKIYCIITNDYNGDISKADLSVVGKITVEYA